MNNWPRRFWEYISRSTLKREFATFLTGWLITMATYLILTAPTFENKWRVLEAFLWPVLGGAFSVFGLDWISKQTTIAGPPANTEITTKTGVTDTSATTTQTNETKL